MTQKTLKAGIWGAVASIITTTTLTIWGELYAPLKNWLAGTFSHHWLGKSLISIAVFFGVWLISYFLLRGEESDDSGAVRLLKLLAAVTILATVLLIVFYLYEYFK